MEHITLGNIKRVNEFLSPEHLENSEVVRFENMVLDSVGGRAIKRGGFTKFNTNAIGAAVYSLYDATDTSGNNYLLASAGTTIKKSLNGTGTWSNLKTGLTANQKMSVVPYNGRFIITNGVDAPFSTDLTNLYGLGVTAPSITALTSTAFPGGDLTPNSSYKWCMCYLTDFGELSPASRIFSHYLSARNNNSTDDTYQGVTFTGLPVSGDARVVSKLIFRTEADGEAFYLVTTIDNDITTFVDGKADTSLDKSQTIPSIAIPTIAKYICIHKERLLLGNVVVPDYTIEPIVSTSGSGTYTFDAIQDDYPYGGMTAGTYGYRVIWVDKNNNISNYLTASVTIASGKNSARIGHIPLPTIASVACRIYRTKVGGSTYYYWGEATTESVTDMIADSALSTDTLPAASTASTTYKCGVLFSEISKPAQLSLYDPNDPSSSFIIQVFPDDGDEITGLLDYEDRVLVFKKNSICQIITSGDPLSGGWRVEKISSMMGCNQPNSIQRAGQYVYFINNNSIYRFPDSVEKPFSLLFKNTLASVTSFRHSAYSNYYHWYVVVVSISGNDHVLIYDEKVQTWYKFAPLWSAMDIQCACEKTQGSSKGTLLFGDSGTAQAVFKYDTTAILDDATNDITPLIKFKTLTMNENTYLARLRKILCNYKKADHKSVAHYLYDVDSWVSKTATDSTNATNSTDYKNYSLVTDAMTGTLQRSPKFYYQIAGAGLAEFSNMVLWYRTEKRETRGY